MSIDILTHALTSVKILPMNNLSRLAWSMVWLGLSLYLVFTLWLGLTGLVYPYQLDYGEGIVLWFTQQLARGQAIYKPLADFPYASSNYPPVALLLSAALMPVFGDGYTAGRLLNFASALIVAALIFRIVHTETRNRFSAALAGLFFIGSPYLYHWVPLFRVDLIGLAFAFAGVYIIWKFSQQSTVNSRQSNRFTGYWLLATVFFLLALYTKHTLIAAPAAAFFALWTRNRKHAIAFALALGISGGAIYLLIDGLTRGGFTAGLIESNATVFLFDQLIALLQHFAFTFPILLALALWAWFDHARAKRLGVLEWYTITAFAGLVLAGRVGAWENYFFEAIVVVCLFASFKLSRWNVERQTINLFLPVLLLVQLVLMWHDPRLAADLIAQDFPANQQLSNLLRQTQGVVISEEMGALATNGKPVAYYTFQYSSLARSGKWDQRWELDGLRETQFPVVILERGTREDVDHYRRFTREFVSALDRYYERAQTIGKYEIYKPAPALRLQSAEFSNAIALVGWNVQRSTLNVDTLNVAIVWQAKRALDRRYTAFVHLEKIDGEKMAQQDREPRGGLYPTTRWADNEMVREIYTLPMPNDWARESLVLKIGWYDAETGERLSVPGSADDTIIIQALEGF